MKKLLFSLFIAGITSFSYAQTSVTLSVDGATLYYGGYAFEGGLNKGKSRVAFSFEKVEVPDFANTDFATVRKVQNSLNLTATRFLKDDQTGLHFGLNTGLVISEELKSIDSLGNIDQSIAAVNQTYFNVGVVAGYMLFPFKRNEGIIRGLYIEPQIGLLYAIGKNDLALGAQIIEKKPIAVDLPKINIGWEFIIN